MFTINKAQKVIATKNVKRYSGRENNGGRIDGGIALAAIGRPANQAILSPPTRES